MGIRKAKGVEIDAMRIKCAQWLAESVCLERERPQFLQSDVNQTQNICVFVGNCKKLFLFHFIGVVKDFSSTAHAILSLAFALENQLAVLVTSDPILIKKLL